MQILLDTHVALWVFHAPDRVPPAMMKALRRAENELVVSQVSTWEIQIKYDAGKLSLPALPAKFLPEAIRASGLDYLPISDDAIFMLGRLPPVHRDPFDRLLVAHALTTGMTIATIDEQIRRYPVMTV